jgi:hypothetical protein
MKANQFFLTLCLLAACTPKQGEEQLMITTTKADTKPVDGVVHTSDSMSVYNAAELEIDLNLFANNPGTDSTWYETFHDLGTTVKADSNMVVSYFKITDTSTSPLRFKSPTDFEAHLAKVGYEKVSEEKVEYPNGQSSIRFKFRKSGK